MAGLGITTYWTWRNTDHCSLKRWHQAYNLRQRLGFNGTRLSVNCRCGIRAEAMASDHQEQTTQKASRSRQNWGHSSSESEGDRTRGPPLARHMHFDITLSTWSRKQRAHYGRSGRRCHTAVSATYCHTVASRIKIRSCDSDGCSCSTTCWQQSAIFRYKIKKGKLQRMVMTSKWHKDGKHSAELYSVLELRPSN